jgi:S-disulfanyl-L-cysteine oxidoreductase SoxD
MPSAEAISTTLLVLAGLAAAACGGANHGAIAAPAVAEQVDLGEGLFRRRCAQCHGSEGRGGRAPNVIGAGALNAQPSPGAKMRTEAFPTAGELLAWTQKRMPPGTAEDLTPAEHAAVVAYMLAESGFALGAQPLDAESAKRIKLR